MGLAEGAGLRSMTMTKPRSRMCRVAKLRVGDEMEVSRGQWAVVTELSHGFGNLYAVKLKRGSKEYNFPMFAERAVRIVRR